MINFLLNLRRRKRCKEHRRKMERICFIGKDFNGLASHRSAEQAFDLFRLNIMPTPRKCVTIGDCCTLSATGIVNERGSISIGNYVYMNQVHMRVDYHLQIGSYCMFGPGVKLLDTSNHPLSVSERHKQCEFIARRHGRINSYIADGGDIIIEDDVWIGMDALILGPVRIGKGAVVAARSVVTKDVEPMTLVAGVPAKKIRDVPS